MPSPPRILGAAGYSWNNVTILGGGFVTGIAFSPAMAGLIYARTDVGGAYRWQAGSGRWMPMTDWIGRDNANWMGIESIAPDPLDPKTVYLAAGEYLGPAGVILRSTDMGTTWDPPHPLPGNVSMGGNADGRSVGERLAIDPNLTSRLYFGSRNDGLFRSDDSGTTWTAVSFPTTGLTDYGLSIVLFDRGSGSSGAGSARTYVGVSPGNLPQSGPSLYRTTDGGSSWQPVPGAPSGQYPNHAAIDDRAGMMYLTYGAFSGPSGASRGPASVWKLDMSSDGWKDVTPSPGTRGGYGGVTVDAQTRDTVVVSTLDRWPDEIYRSTDGGGKWSAIGQSSSHDVAGANWLFWGSSSIGTTTALGWMGDIEIDPHDSKRALYNTGQGIWWSEDLTASPVTWSFRNAGLEETVALGLISPSRGAHLLTAVGDIGGFRHDDLSVSPAGGMFKNPVFGNTTGIDYAELYPDVIARVGTTSSNGNSSKHGAFSFDGGTTWTPFPNEPSSEANAGTIAVSADGATFVWAPQSGGAEYSRDQGDTWAACGGLPGGVQVTSDRVNPGKFYATSSTRNGATLYVSTDGGASFSTPTPLPRGATVRPVYGVEGDLWIAAGTGLYRWTEATPLVPPRPVSGISEAAAVGFGVGAECGSYVVYVAGHALVAGQAIPGVFASENLGVTWQRIDDPQHQFGAISDITGDPRVYGRVYLGSGGRGILYGDPK